LVGPKAEGEERVKGRRYAVVPIKSKDPAKPDGWKYEEGFIPDIKTGSGLLVRVLIAKIGDEGRFHQIVRETPVHPEGDQWNCRFWIEDVLKRLFRDENGAVGTSVLDWERIEALVHKFVSTKVENGTYARPGWHELPAPTWNMLNAREIYP
jgi:hypothetical protein